MQQPTQPQGSPERQNFVQEMREGNIQLGNLHLKLLNAILPLLTAHWITQLVDTTGMSPLTDKSWN